MPPLSQSEPPAGVTSNGPAAAPPAMPSGDLPPPATSGQPDVPPVVAGAQQPAAPAQQAAAFATGVPQPLAFIVPLVMLAGAAFFARVFTRDATPRTMPS
jgi:hypothetical protein